MGKNIPLDFEALEKTYKAYLAEDNHVTNAAKKLGLARSTVRERLDRYAEITGVDLMKKLAGGTVEGVKPLKESLPKKGTIKRYILTTAQNNTHINKPFWQNILAFAEHLGARIMISRITYNKASYRANTVKVNKGPTIEDEEEMWFDPQLNGHFHDERILLAPTLAFCAEQQINPTAVRPLSGFNTFPASSISAIFPHTTFSMESTAVMRGSPAKLNYTTGAVTLKNYIQKKEGMKAEFHHAFGALLVEVNDKGEWWVRQLNAVDDGSFYDLEYLVKDGTVTAGHRVEAINWGDIHNEELDPVVAEANWGEGGILDSLKPRFQMMHDTIDFYARNHHRRHDPHAGFARFVENRGGVEDEMKRVAIFLNVTSYRDWCTTYVVDSNHDNALKRWLREADYRTDPENAEFFLTCQQAQYSAIRKKDPNFHLAEHALRALGVVAEVRFLRADESFLLCKTIEAGMHGHLGPNGTRGDPWSLSRVGRKANVGHFHSAAIIHGLYVSGTCSKLDLEYTHGPSSWSHSHIVTYKNGKRCIMTLRGDKWRA